VSDIFLVTLALGFFAASLGLAAICHRLMES
jgi:hypothetical protein